MRNLKLTIEYDGTDYAGWQTQRTPQTANRKPRTIQSEIERVLSRILQEKVNLTASGRTDAGVHAAAQVANFKTAKSIPPDKLQRALNGLLPPDIVITKIEEVPADFHSRFSAKSKVYRYAILNRPYPSAFLRNRAYFYPYPLDVAAMRKCARRLVGRHDFKAFCNSGSSAKSTIRTIKKISIKKTGYLITIDIEADGFLYNMARRIVGSLINGSTAPARGLCLMKVNY